MRKVEFHEDVITYLNELVDILYDKEYFSFKDYSIEYVTKLVFDIRDNLPLKHKKIAPKYFSKYGADLYFTTFRTNNRTQWYVFFIIHKDVYYVQYIGNNHTVSQYL